MSPCCSVRTVGRFGLVVPLRAGSSPLPEGTENPGRSLWEERVQIPTASLNCYTKQQRDGRTTVVTVTVLTASLDLFSSHLSYCGGGLMLLAGPSAPLSKARGLPGAADSAGLLTDVS